MLVSLQPQKRHCPADSLTESGMPLHQLSRQGVRHRRAATKSDEAEPGPGEGLRFRILTERRARRLVKRPL
jgi:hypothetical protein